MKHAYTRLSNVNSKVQTNMHTSRNNQCNPDMQCSNTWTMDTSHDWKSNTKSIIITIYINKLGSIGRFGRTSGFSTVTLMRSMFVCGGWRKADYSRLRDPDRRKIYGLSISLQMPKNNVSSKQKRLVKEDYIKVAIKL